MDKKLKKMKSKNGKFGKSKKNYNFFLKNEIC